MKASVYITTFRKTENQGAMLPVGTIDLEIIESVMPLVRHNGCISGEIIHNNPVKSVMLAGRQFVVGEGWGEEFRKSGAKFLIAVPSEVAESIRKEFQICPHCHQRINQQ